MLKIGKWHRELLGFFGISWKNWKKTWNCASAQQELSGSSGSPFCFLPLPTRRWRGQNMPYQNMPLGHKDYLELSSAETEQTQKELSALPICRKAEHSSQVKVSFPDSPSRKWRTTLSQETRGQDILTSRLKSAYLPLASPITFTFPVYCP